jgi:small subunit ribosomal protein S2
MQKVENTKEKEKKENIIIEKMFEAGAHYGYGKSRRHPSVYPYIYATKKRVDIIDLEKTSIMLSMAMEFIKKLGAEGKVILFVGTKPEAKEIIQSSAESIDMPYVTERWIGGTLSNFTEIKKRITELDEYRKNSSIGGLDKYTKKERLVITKKMERLAKYYSGLIDLQKTPDALFIIDPKNEHIALIESQKSNIPIVALANSDSNIKNIDYPIVANDTGISFFTKSITEAYKKGLSSVSMKKEEELETLK